VKKRELLISAAREGSESQIGPALSLHGRSLDHPIAAVASAIAKVRDRQRVGTGADLDCGRAYVGKLETEGVQSPRAEAARAKAALLTIKELFTQRLYPGVRPATLPVSGSNIRQLVYECPSLHEWTTAPQLRQVKEPELLSSALCCVAWYTADTEGSQKNDETLRIHFLVGACPCITKVSEAAIARETGRGER
jgi:hypothetical protein